MNRSLLLTALLAGCVSTPSSDVHTATSTDRPMLAPQTTSVAEVYVCRYMGAITTEVAWPLDTAQLGVTLPPGDPDPLVKARKRTDRALKQLDTNQVASGILKLRNAQKKIDEAGSLGWAGAAAASDTIISETLTLVDDLLALTDAQPGVPANVVPDATALRDLGVDKLDAGKPYKAMKHWSAAVDVIASAVDLSTPVCGLAPEIVYDGNWATVPWGATGIARHPETDGLTLASDPLDQVLVLQPQPELGANEQTLNGFSVVDGKLQFSHGDWNLPSGVEGPAKSLVEWDSTTGDVMSVFDDVPEDGFGAWTGGPRAGMTVVAGLDATETDTFGSVYTRRGRDFVKHRSMWGTEHVFDVATFNGRLYAARGGNEYYTPGEPRGVMVSDDGGMTWDYDEAAATPVNGYASSQALEVVEQTDGSWLYAITSDMCCDGPGQWFPKHHVYRTDGAIWEDTHLRDLLPVGTHFNEPQMTSFQDWVLVTGDAYDGSGNQYPHVLVSNGEGTWELALPDVDEELWSPRCAADAETLVCVAEDWLYDGSWTLLGRYAWSTDAITIDVDGDAVANWTLVGELAKPDPWYSYSAMALYGGRLYTGYQAWYGITAPLGVYAGAYDSYGTFEGRTFTVDKGSLEGGSLEWNADLPPGTSIRFQVRSANKSDKLQSKPWRGPDGTPDTWYETSGEWLSDKHDKHKLLQYRVELETSDPAVSPLLHGVWVVPGTTAGDWGYIGPSGTPNLVSGQPASFEIGLVSQSSAAPIRFNGPVQLSARDMATGSPVKIEPTEVDLVDGRIAGIQAVTLYEATAQTEVRMQLGAFYGSTHVTVEPGPVDHYALAPNLPEPQPGWSPIASTGLAFQIDVTALDHWGNNVIDATANLSCHRWSHSPTPLATGTVQSGLGTVVVSSLPAGEWNIVCEDEDGNRGQVTVKAN